MALLTQFTNCLILRNHKFVREDLWVRNGIIQDPEKIFFDQKVKADIRYDCHGLLIAPGLIDVQINGAVGCDFSLPSDTFKEDIARVAKTLLSNGVTSFCPTVITSPSDLYKQILPSFKRTEGSQDGAGILGLHIEGPFISVEKRGAHPVECLRTFTSGFQDLMETYGSLDNVCIFTLAPELTHSMDVIKELVKRDIVVSIGHSTANLSCGEDAARNGASFITHLFNAMLPFHHRDPHLVGLLASDEIPKDRTMFYGIISDGIHTHAAALRIAYRTHPKGIVLVTDACPVMGFPDGTVYHMGQQKMEIRNGGGYIAGTETLCGSVAELNKCVQFFQHATGCSVEEALEAASLHPAQLLRITDRKGTLEFTTDADFILLDSDLNVHATFVAGERVWSSDRAETLITQCPN